jgi:sugar lactone lactonase YvrE
VITPDGVASVLTISGLATALGHPTGLAFDAAGNLYISDYSNGRVVEISCLLVAGSTSQGIGTVIATKGYTTTPLGITGVAVDSMGNIYIPDGYAADPSRVIKVTAAGAASLLTPTGITFSRPEGVTADGMGNLYVADGGHNRIVEITTAGVASVLAFNSLPSPTTLGTPFGITVDPFGNLYIPDSGNNRVLFSNVSGSALTFPSTATGATSAAKTATVTNLGNQPLVFSTNPTYTANFANYSGDENPCTSSTSLLAGTACDVAVEFTPQSVGSLSAGITLTNSALNVAGSTQQVAVSGTAFSGADATSTTVTVAPTSLTNGQAAGITATVADQPHSGTHPTGSVTFNDTLGTTTTTISSASLSSGAATLSGVVLHGVGTHTLSANYAGVSGSFAASSGTVTVVLSKSAVTVSGPTTQPVTVTYGQSAAVTITVAGPYNTIAAPTGTISYSILNASNASVGLGTPALTAGSTHSSATIPIPSVLASGSYTISVTYSGDGNYSVTSTATTIALSVGPIAPATSTAMTVTPTSVANGQAASITATVTDQAHSSTHPTGSVTFNDTLGTTTTALSSAILSSGAATLTGVVLHGAGTHTLSANYAGVSGSFAASSGTVSVVLSKAAATVSGPTTQPVVVAYGQSGSVTIAITGPYNTIAAPTGTISYSILNASNASVGLGTPALTAGSTHSSATIPIPNNLARGSYTISVTYGGDGNYSVTSTATTIPLSVGQITPTISWSPGTTAITYGAASGRILDASALNGRTAVQGTFTYTATLSGGTAVPVTGASILGAGSYTLTATFTPTDTTTYKTVSATATITVNQASQSISFTPPASPVTYGVSPITLAASSGSSGIAVTFSVTGPGALSGNTLTITGAGTVIVTASQAGNTNYTAATPMTQTIVVIQASASVSLTASPNPLLVTDAVTFTATVASAAGTPTGTVSFFDGTTLLGTAALSSGEAVITTSTLAAATHSITAAYSGSTNTVLATSSALAELVQDYSLSISGSSGGGNGSGGGSSGGGNSQTVAPGGTATYTLALGPSNGATFPAPVTLTLTGLPPGATGSITPNLLPAGSSLTNVTLSIQLPQVTASLDKKPTPRRHIPPVFWGLLLLPFAGGMRRTGKRLGAAIWVLMLLFAGLTAMATLNGCGSLNGFNGQQQKTYVVTVIATSGKLSRSTNLSLTVQ